MNLPLLCLGLFLVGSRAGRMRRLAPRFFGFFHWVILASLILYVLASVVTLNLIYMAHWNRQAGPETPATYGLAYQEVNFPAVADKLTLSGWFLPAEGDRAIIMVHGRGSNRADREVYTLQLAADLHRAGYNVLTFDLRAHGQSQGWYTSFGLYEQRDLLGAWHFLKERGFKSEKMGVWAWSMGAATTLLAMDDRDKLSEESKEIRVAVLDSGFADLRSELEGQAPGPLSLLLPGVETSSLLLMSFDLDRVRPVEALRNLQGHRLMLIHGLNDDSVPPWNLSVLREAGGSNIVESWAVPNAGHALAYRSRPAEYATRLIAFFDHELG